MSFLARFSLTFDADPSQLLNLSGVPLFALRSTEGPAQSILSTLYGLPELSCDNGVSLLKQSSEASPR